MLWDKQERYQKTFGKIFKYVYFTLKALVDFEKRL